MERKFVKITFYIFITLSLFVLMISGCGNKGLESVHVYEQFRGVAFASSFRIWAVGPYEKVSDQENFESSNYIWDGEAVNLICGRGEVEPFQLLIGAEFGNLDDIEVEIDDLSCDAGTIPAENIELFFEYYINCQSPSDADGWGGEIPDPLVPLDGKFDLAKAYCQPIYVRITVPADATPGVYSGVVSVKAAGATTEKATIDLEVVDVSVKDDLPDYFVALEPRIITSYYGTTPGSGDAVKILQSFEDILISRGATPLLGSYPLMYNSSSESGAASDWAARVATDFVSGYSNLTIVPMLETAESKLPDVSSVGKAYNKLYDELSSRGGDVDNIAIWINALGGSDDPFDADNVSQEWWDSIGEMKGDWQGTPKIFACASPMRATPPALDLHGKVDCWVAPFADFTADLPTTLKAEGDLYINLTDAGVTSIDTEGSTAILTGWYGYLFDAEGAVAPPMTRKKPYFETNPWTDDPMISDGRDSGNGMGVLVYPGEPVGSDLPVSSLRLELLQQAMEDWALLRMLEKKYDRKYVEERLLSRLPLDIMNPRQVSSKDISTGEMYEIRKSILRELAGGKRTGYPVECSGKITNAKGLPIYGAWVGDQHFGTYTNANGEYTLNNAASERGGFTVIASGYGTNEASPGTGRSVKMYRTLRGLVKVFDFETEYVEPGHWLAGDDDDALMVERGKDKVYEGTYAVRFDFASGKYTKAVNLYAGHRGFSKYHRVVFSVYNPHDFLLDINFLLADDLDYDTDDQYTKRLILRPNSWNHVSLRIKEIKKREERTFAIGSSGRYAMKRSYVPDLDEISAIGFSCNGLSEYGAAEGEKITIYIDDLLLLMYPE